MPLELGARVGRFMKLGNVTAPMGLRQTDLNSLAVAEVELPGVEVLRAGRRFSAGHINGATFQAQQTAVPTTTAGLLVYNGEAGPNAKSYVVVEAITYQAGGTTATGAVTLFGAVLRPGKADFTVPTSVAAGTAVTSLSGKTPGSNALTALNQTLANNGASAWNWVPLAVGVCTALWEGAQATSYSAALLLVPPGGALALTAVSSGGTTPTFGLSALWDELELDIE